MLKRTCLIILASGFVLGSCDSPQKKPEVTSQSKNEVSSQESGHSSPNKPIEINIKKLSEAYGNNIIKQQSNLPRELQYDADRLIKGIRDNAAGKPSPLSTKEYEQFTKEYQEELMKVYRTNKLKEINLLFQKNKSIPGLVEVIPGKLQYKIIKTGSGSVVYANTTPLVKLKGLKADGSDMQTHNKKLDTIPLKLNSGFPGLSLTIPGMKEGEIRVIYIHPEIIKTSSPSNNFFDPIIFEVEVIQANDPQSNTLRSVHEKEDDDDDYDNFDEPTENKPSVHESTIELKRPTRPPF